MQSFYNKLQLRIVKRYDGFFKVMYIVVNEFCVFGVGVIVEIIVFDQGNF